MAPGVAGFSLQEEKTPKKGAGARDLASPSLPCPRSARHAWTGTNVRLEVHGEPSPGAVPFSPLEQISVPSALCWLRRSQPRAFFRLLGQSRAAYVSRRAAGAAGQPAGMHTLCPAPGSSRCSSPRCFCLSFSLPVPPKLAPPKVTTDTQGWSLILLLNRSSLSLGLEGG